MKKIITIALASASIGLLTACGSTATDQTSVTEPTLAYELPADFTEGFDEPVSAMYSSSATDNGLGGTRIWIHGIAQNIESLDDGVYITSVSDGSHSWIIQLGTADVQDRKDFEPITYNPVTVCGVYEGMSGVYNKPAITPIKIFNHNDGKTIQANVGVLAYLIGNAEWKPAETTVQETTPAPTTTTPAPTTTTPDPTTTTSSFSMEQLNAIDKANSYLGVSAFSRKGLIEQLEYEGFSNDAAVFAVDHIDVNWRDQAKIKAKQYLETSAFSRTGLIEQLEYEGFSSDDSTYATDQSGADWNAQAVEKAKSYLSISSFSRDGLIEQLEYEGFTPEQAAYGVSGAGY